MILVKTGLSLLNNEHDMLNNEQKNVVKRP